MAQKRNTFPIRGPGAKGAKEYRGQRIPPVNVCSLARVYTEDAIKTLAKIMRDDDTPAMSRVAAAKVLLDRGWGKCSETHKIDINGETSLLKVVNEIVHVHETREQIEFRDQTPLLELAPEDTERQRLEEHALGPAAHRPHHSAWPA
jgi:hypothetical protein